MTFDIVVALDRDRGIGRGGNLPWRLPGDMAHFVELTKTAPPGYHNAVLMGRTTWESIPRRFRPLVGRRNIVLSRSVTSLDGATVAASFADGLLSARGAPRIFVIGGGAVYAEALAHPDCRDVYLTRVEGTFDCDVFFPQPPPGGKVVAAGETLVENGICYRFEQYRLPGR